MKILMTNNTLAERGGSESYLETVSSELRRLGHEVVFYSAECGRDGRSPATATGFEVLDDVADLPQDLDVIHGSTPTRSPGCASGYRAVPLVFATHSWFVSIEDPVAELGAGAFVAFNELTRRRLAAHVATRGSDDRPADPAGAGLLRRRGSRPGRGRPAAGGPVSRRMTLSAGPAREGCAGLGLEFERIGRRGRESADPRAGHAGLRHRLRHAAGARSRPWPPGRAVVVVEEGGVERVGERGVVRRASRPTASPVWAPGGRGRSSSAWRAARRLHPGPRHPGAAPGVRHHAAQHHAAALVELYTAVADTAPTAGTAREPRPPLQDRFALEYRAVCAEWEVARLEAQVRELRAELDGLAPSSRGGCAEREHLVAGWRGSATGCAGPGRGPGGSGASGTGPRGAGGRVRSAGQESRDSLPSSKVTVVTAVTRTGSHTGTLRRDPSGGSHVGSGNRRRRDRPP